LGRERLGIPNDDFVFAYFGYIYPGKGIEFLLPAFKSVISRHRNARLLLVGGHGDDPFAPAMTLQNKRYYQEMQRLATELKLADRVIWTGTCNTETEEGSVYLSAADACVLPFSYGIRLNNSSLAAAVCHGLPTITTRAKTKEGAFVDCVNLLLCLPECATSLMAAMDDLISQPDHYARLQSGTQDLAREWFSWDKALARTLSALGVHSSVVTDGTS
jgi:glycosyltransferase involved in cell wall biosynthesis